MCQCFCRTIDWIDVIIREMKPVAHFFPGQARAARIVIGERFIDNLEPSNRGVVRIGDASCGFAFDFRPVAGQQVEIGPVVCR